MSNLPDVSSTELVINEQTLPIIEQITEGMPGGFFIYHADGDEELIFVNNAMLRLFGCDTLEQFEALTGNTFPGLVHPDDIDRVESVIAKQIRSGPDNMDYVEYRIKRADGEVRWVLDYGHFVHTKNLGDIFYVFIVDSTEERMQERELEKAQYASQAKSAFLFNMSHDVRTPLNAIVGFSALARRHLNDPEHAQECLDKIDDASDYLIRLIDDVLDMSLIESGTLRIQEAPCNVLDQLDFVVEMLAPKALEKGLDFMVEKDAPGINVNADPLNLRRIFAKVISNAINYTPKGGSVSVSATGDWLDDSSLSYCITIADTGIGIKQEFLDSIFEIFEREQNTTISGKPGAGLGLSITKGLVSMMGGTIGVTSQKGEGTTFVIELPFVACDGQSFVRDAMTEAFREHTVEHLQGRRVLVVEDNELNRMITEAVLKEAGFVVETVADGVDAVEIISSKSEGYYDLVLMDIQMPVMNGYDATRAIRALDRADTSELPILALSANAMDEDRRRSIESGMNAHMAKPINVSSLLREISAYIQ